MDTNSNNSNQSNNEGDHNTNQREGIDPNKNKNKNKEKDHDHKWVHNLSSTPLTDVQKKILSRGPNFAILPKYPPVGKYIASIENACTKLKPGKAERIKRRNQDHPQENQDSCK